MNKYQIVYADPAWKFASNSKGKPSRNPMRHYPCMTDAEISEIPVAEWTEKDALLLMWTTAPMLVRSLSILPAWKFKYVSQVVWVKDHIATGYWARNRHEILLICKRGKFPLPDQCPFPDSVITEPKREHSRKPDSIRNRIAEVWPDARKLEMNARIKVEGWDVWGNEVEKFGGASNAD